MFKIISAVLFVLFSVSHYSYALVIDDFTDGSFSIVASGIGMSIVRTNISEQGVSVGETTGTRNTWVQDGIDYDPSIAVLSDETLHLGFDNDENHGGIDYTFDTNLNLSSESGIAFDISYDHNSLYGSIGVGITLTDTSGQSASGHVTLGSFDYPFTTNNGTHIFDFTSNFLSSLDMTSISYMSLQFGTGVDYAGFCHLHSIYTTPAPIPEPSTILLFSFGFMFVIKRAFIAQK